MKVLYKTLKWSLIAFVIFSILLGIRRCYYQQYNTTDEISYNQLQPLVDGQIQLVLFHNQKRCHQCLQMQQFAEEVLKEQFFDATDSGSLVFNTLTIDEPENQPLIQQFGIFAATLVLMEFEGDKLVYARVLIKGPELYKQEVDFKNYLTEEISDILSVDYE
jgi:hypothetical protein